MHINVLIEPDHRHSAWDQLVLAGISAEARRRKYAVTVLDQTVLSCAEGSDPLVIVVGSDVAWLQQALQSAAKAGYRAIVISPELPHTAGQSVVQIDYREAAEHIVRYLFSCGRRKLALFGANSSSATDRKKASCFVDCLTAYGVPAPERSVFRSHGKLDDCLREFLSARKEFDAVLCVNDLVAVYLQRQLRLHGVSVPDDLFLACFGESPLTENAVPSITSISLDHAELGMQAVRLYAYLFRQNSRLSVTAHLQSCLNVGGSTASIPDPAASSAPLIASAGDASDFYGDPAIAGFLRFEKFYCSLEPIDYKILTLLRQNISLEAIAQKCNSSVSTVNYHLRNMYDTLGVRSRRELIEYVQNVLGD